MEDLWIPDFKGLSPNFSIGKEIVQDRYTKSLLNYAKIIKLMLK